MHLKINDRAGTVVALPATMSGSKSGVATRITGVAPQNACKISILDIVNRQFLGELNILSL